MSDSDESTKSKIVSNLDNIKSERQKSNNTSASDSTSESEESSNSESKIDIKKERESNERTDNGEIIGGPTLFHNIKEEKCIKRITTFIPRPIKSEPQSDTEGTSEMKTSTSSKSLNHQTKIRIDRFCSPIKKTKQNQNLDTTSTFDSPLLSSTLKIKQEPPSEDESVKRKRSKKTNKNKSLLLIESDVFESFLN